MVDCKIDMKTGSLLVLVLQNTLLAILMRYTRTREELYISTTAVAMGEILKLSACFVVILNDLNYDFGAFFTLLNEKVWQNKFDTLKLAVPAVLYSIQNNLQYIAASNLDPATFQVTYQMKIFTTASFSVVMLNKVISKEKWIALVCLVTGVGLVQYSANAGKSSANTDGDTFIGLIAVCCACLTSGFSGVYFEKILKGSDTSLWVRNVQLSIWGVLAALLTVIIQDGAQVAEFGFFQNYTLLVWMLISTSAFGGLLTAVVVKYADNILKAFATSLAIILTSLTSVYLFDFQISLGFIGGSAIVIGSVYMYSRPDPPADALRV